MAYGPAGRDELQALHFSALDSIIPEASDRFFPGPITELSFPRYTRVQMPVFGLGINANIFKEDAEAAQALIDREFLVLRRYQHAANWQEAWKRFYRAIYRDSFDRVIDIAFQVERKLAIEAEGRNSPLAERDFADQVLSWVQSFEYERDLLGSDFINLVSAATEGRGDCDNRAMLWAIVLRQAGIPSAIMVSRLHSHAMGLADLPGPGARFPIEGQRLLVAETVANVSIGLIDETMSEIDTWLGILFE
jgi:transglutaminase-like putative cysteine protease